MAAPVAVYRQEGCSLDYTPVADVAAGDVIDLGNFVGIAHRAITANTLGALHVMGVYRVNKYANEAIAIWAKVYWDQGTLTATGTSGYSEAVMGIAVAAAAGSDTTVDVLIFPHIGE